MHTGGYIKIMLHIDKGKYFVHMETSLDCNVMAFYEETIWPLARLASYVSHTAWDLVTP